MQLKFSDASDNAKLKKLAAKLKAKVYTFSLMSGHSCPYAKDCHSQAVEASPGKWKIKDGKHTKFRCFSASQEVLFPTLRNQRKNNMRILDIAGLPMGDIQAGNIIVNSIPKNAEVIRIHIGGDFKTLAYFDAWCYVARTLPHITFYAYTKSLPFWVKRIDTIPSNLLLTASYGGYRDDLIAKYNLRFSKVVYSKNEAKRLKLEIDIDDSHAATVGPSFALLIHGQQPKGSVALKALQAIRKVKAAS